MNDLAEIIVALIFIVIMVIFAVFAMTLPFAFLGFVVFSFVNIFNAGIDVTYFNSFIGGFVFVLIASVIFKD